MEVDGDTVTVTHQLRLTDDDLPYGLNTLHGWLTVRRDDELVTSRIFSGPFSILRADRDPVPPATLEPPGQCRPYERDGIEPVIAYRPEGNPEADWVGVLGNELSPAERRLRWLSEVGGRPSPVLCEPSTEVGTTFLLAGPDPTAPVIGSGTVCAGPWDHSFEVSEVDVPQDLLRGLWRLARIEGIVSPVQSRSGVPSPHALGSGTSSFTAVP